MMDMLETRMKNLSLQPEQMELLRNGLKNETFSKNAADVANQLRQRGKHQEAHDLRDMSPLFDPHDFWHNQPVPKVGEQLDASKYDKAIETKKVSDVPKEALPLPGGYNWCNVDLNDDAQAEEVYTLLTMNYVEDDDAMFRFDYSVPFLRWALLPPGQPAEWLVGVRGGKKQRLFGFIAGIPVSTVCNGKSVKMCEINFLCVHKDLRAKRLAPVLIKEVTRRVNLKNVWQAVYTAGITIPTPITAATYWHRSLNPKKLVEVGFSALPPGQPMARYIKLHKLPTKTSIPGLRPMKKSDVPRVHELLNAYLAKTRVHFHFSQQEIAYFLLPRDGVVHSYVVEDAKQVTDFFSFYSLPSTVLRHEKHKVLNVAYSFYNVSTTDRLKQGMEDMLVLAREADYDVFNCLDLMENQTFLETLKFGIGDGHLHYYLYNWRVGGEALTPQDIGIVLV